MKRNILGAATLSLVTMFSQRAHSDILTLPIIQHMSTLPAICEKHFGVCTLVFETGKLSASLTEAIATNIYPYPQKAQMEEAAQKLKCLNTMGVSHIQISPSQSSFNEQISILSTIDRELKSVIKENTKNGGPTACPE
jgi:hypothetical protein